MEIQNSTQKLVEYEGARNDVFIQDNLFINEDKSSGSDIYVTESITQGKSSKEKKKVLAFVLQKNALLGDSCHSAANLFTCHMCNRGFIHMRFLKQHLWQHKGKIFKPVMSRVELKKSLKTFVRVPCGKKLYSCQTCNKGFSNKCYLRRHCIFHIEGRMAEKCQICLKGCSSKSHLEVITGGSSFVCQLCKQNMPALLSNVEKLFQCHMCNKRFSKKKTLNYHLFQHSQKQAFLCHICNKAYSRPNKLKVHLFKHTDKK